MSAKNSGRVAIHQRKHKYCWRYLDAGDKTCYLSVFTIVAISSFVSHGYILPSIQIYFYHPLIRYGNLYLLGSRIINITKWKISSDLKGNLRFQTICTYFSMTWYTLFKKSFAQSLWIPLPMLKHNFFYIPMRENQIKYCHFCRLYKRLFPIAIDLHRKYIHLKPWCIHNSIWDLKAILSLTHVFLWNVYQCMAWKS